MAFGFGKLKNIFANNPAKDAIRSLAGLLEQVDGSLKIAKAVYQESKDCISILYGVQGVGNFTTKSVGGWEIYTYLANADNFKNPGTQQSIEISGKQFTASSTVIKQFQKILNSIASTIDTRLANAALPPNGVLLKLQNYNLTEQISDKKNDPDLVLNLINQKMPFKYSIKPIDLLENDRRSIYYYIFYDYIRFIGRHPINQSQSLTRSLNLPSGREYQNMLKIGLRKLNIIPLLTITEVVFESNIDTFSKLAVKTNRDNGVSFEIKRGYVFGADKTNTYFSINGLHLAVACFALLEEPSIIPLQLIIEIIQEFGKPEVQKQITSTHDASVFLGEEAKFIESLIKKENIEDSAKRLNKSKRTTLKDSIQKLKVETGEDISIPANIVEEYETHQTKPSAFNNQNNLLNDENSNEETTSNIPIETLPIDENTAESIEGNTKETEEATTTPPTANRKKTESIPVEINDTEFDPTSEQTSPSKFEVFPSETNISDEIMKLQEIVEKEELLYTPNGIVDATKNTDPSDALSATFSEATNIKKLNPLFSYTTEKEIHLRLQDMAKDITVQIVMEQNKNSKNFTKEIVSQINTKVFQIILDLYYNTYLFKKDSQLCIYSNQEGMFDKPLNKKVYYYIMRWRNYKENRFRKIWGLPLSEPKEFNRDISNKLVKILKLKDLFELDQKFKNNEFYLRYTDSGIKTCIHNSSSAQAVIDAVNVSMDDGDESSFTANHPINDIKNSIMTHWYQFKGDSLFRCDITRVLDFLYDLAFFYNSEHKNTLPDQATFDMLKKGIRDLEAMGLIKRKLFEDYLITIIPKKIPNDLDSDKYQILEFFQKIGEKYKDLQFN